MKIEETFDFAADWHAGQERKGFKKAELHVPYIIHPLDVTRELSFFGIHSEEYDYMWHAAILHDVVEDTDCTYDVIKDTFGYIVYTLVNDLTMDEGQDKEEYMASFKKTTIESLIIKVADRICNVRDYRGTNPTYADKYFRKASVLFKTFEDRKKEIVKEFGQDVLTRMESRIKSVTPGVVTAGDIVCNMNFPIGVVDEVIYGNGSIIKVN